MIRRIGKPPRRGQHYTLRAGAYAILPLNGRLLLTNQDGDIQLPGGGIEQDESPIRALHREVHEETGWRITGLRRLGAFRRFVFMPEYDLWAEKLCHVFVARPTYPTTQPLEPGHCTLFTSPRQAAQSLGNAGDRLFVARYFGL
jgi:8-oxo-dGTP diphosphatase